MVLIKNVRGESIKDSGGDETINLTIRTTAGEFSASAPNGNSKGKHEAKPYKKSLADELEKLRSISDYFSEEEIENFEDLRRIEDTLEGHFGANTFFALESAALRALAKEKNVNPWEIVNPELKDKKNKKLPYLVGNCIGGGEHAKKELFKRKENLQGEFFDAKNRKADFQEFLLIPDSNSVIESFKTNKEIKNYLFKQLKNNDTNFKEEKNSEGAWITSLNDKRVLEIVHNSIQNFTDTKKMNVESGLDVAASFLYKRKKYNYDNPPLKRSIEEHNGYLFSLIKNFNIYYIEDPFYEDDFESFSNLLENFPDRLIVGDDLTVTNFKRVQKAIKNKSINALIVKPNQVGSLLEVKRVCEICKKNNIKIIFSHRSGETEENILADLAFGFQADFFKCGIDGKERESKIKRLMEIEKNIS